MLHKLSTWGRRALAGAAVAALTVGAVGLTGTAQAATGDARPSLHAGMHAPSTSAKPTVSKTFTIPAGATTFTSGTGSTHFTVTRNISQAPLTVTCTLSVGTPFEYFGGLYGGGEEATASVSCNGFVYAISVEVDLFVNGVDTVYSVNTVYSTSFASVAVEYPLLYAYYQAGAISDVYWSSPSLYSVLGPVYSPTVYLP